MKKNIILVLCFTAAFMNAKAGLILSDSFNYPNGDLVGAASSPWEAHSGAGSGPIQVTNGMIRVINNSSSAAEDINASFAGAPYDTTNNPAVTSVYSSFTMNVTTLPGANGTYFAHFKDSGTFNFRGRLFILTAGTNTGGTFRVGIGSTNSASTTAGFSALPTDLSLNTDYKIVTRLDLATGNSTVWVNPVTEDDIGASSTADPGSAVGISGYAFRQANAAGGVALVDNLKIGTAFANVAGANTSPVISSILNQNTPRNTSVGPISFTIGDDETPGLLTVSATSSNLTLVPDANITLGGSGADRNITVAPAVGQQGSALINVSVSDLTNVTTTSFTVTVGAPSVSPIAGQITSVDQAIMVPFTVTDSENDALAITFDSSDTNLVPNENIVLGGSGNNRTLTVTPAAGLNGNTTINVSVNDGFTTVHTSFNLTVKLAIGLVFADAFDYVDGPIFNNSEVWFHASSGAGTSGDMQVTNGAVILSSALTEDVMANLTNGPFASTTGVVLYCSFTMSNSVLPSQSGGYFMHYRDSAAGSNFRAKLFASTTNAAAGTFRIGIANSANSIDAASQFPLNLASNGTYTVVTRYNVGTGESRLWINPNSESDSSVGASDSPLTSAVGAIALRQDGTGGAIGTRTIDNLKIGTSYTDVMTVTNVAVIPSLAVSTSGGNVLISWPTNATGFALESTITLTSPSWGPVGGAVVSGTNNVVTISNPTGNAFYRLKQ